MVDWVPSPNWQLDSVPGMGNSSLQTSLSFWLGYRRDRSPFDSPSSATAGFSGVGGGSLLPGLVGCPPAHPPARLPACLPAWLAGL